MRLPETGHFGASGNTLRGRRAAAVVAPIKRSSSVERPEQMPARDEHETWPRIASKARSGRARSLLTDHGVYRCRAQRQTPHPPSSPLRLARAAAVLTAASPASPRTPLSFPLLEPDRVFLLLIPLISTVVSGIPALASCIAWPYE